MPDIYHNLGSKDDRVYAPNFVRWNHRYRGPRESLKINQEISQSRFDFKSIDTMVEENNVEFDARVIALVDGGEVENLVFTWFGDATPASLDFELPGITELITRVESVSNRLKALEG